MRNQGTDGGPGIDEGPRHDNKYFTNDSTVSTLIVYIHKVA